MKLSGFSQLFSRDHENLAPLQVISWWETRRIAFNLFVGTAGLATCAVIFFVGSVVESFGKEPIFPDPPIAAVLGVVFYGIAANLCYTMGWVCELTARRYWKSEANAFGRLSFVFGLIGSIALTLIPAILYIILSSIELLVRSPAVR